MEYATNLHKIYGSAFENTYKLTFDFVRGAKEYTAQFGPTGSWTGPSYIFEQVASDNYNKPEISERAEYHVNFDRLQTPSSIARFFGYDDQKARSYVVSKASARYAELYDFLGRTPTQEEAEIMMSYFARNYAQATVTPPLSLGVGFLLGAVIPPKRSPNTVSIPFTKRVLASGQAAARAHRLYRGTLTGLAFYSLTRISLAATLSIGDISGLSDSRLSDIRAAFFKMTEQRRNAAQARLKRAPGGEWRPAITILARETQRSDPFGQGETAMTERWRQHRVNIGAPEARRDGESGGFEDQDMAGDTGFDHPDGKSDDSSLATSTSGSQGLLSFPPERKAGSYTRNQPNQEQAMQYRVASAGARDEADRSAADDFFGEDQIQASSGSGSLPPFKQASDASISGASAWDRVRRGGGQTGSQQVSSLSGGNAGRGGPGRARERREFAQDASTGQDSSQAQAQKDFDDMLERERSGTGPQDESSKW